MGRGVALRALPSDRFGCFGTLCTVRDESPFESTGYRNPIWCDCCREPRSNGYESHSPPSSWRETLYGPSLRHLRLGSASPLPMRGVLDRIGAPYLCVTLAVGPDDVFCSRAIRSDGPPSSKKTSSTALPNSCAILMARGRLESYLPVSIALIICRETPSRSARSA